MERKTIQEDGTRKSQNGENKSRKYGENGSYVFYDPAKSYIRSK